MSALVATATFSFLQQAYDRVPLLVPISFDAGSPYASSRSSRPSWSICRSASRWPSVWCSRPWSPSCSAAAHRGCRAASRPRGGRAHRRGRRAARRRVDRLPGRQRMASHRAVAPHLRSVHRGLRVRAAHGRHPHPGHRAARGGEGAGAGRRGAAAHARCSTAAARWPRPAWPRCWRSASAPRWRCCRWSGACSRSTPESGRPGRAGIAVRRAAFGANPPMLAGIPVRRRGFTPVDTRRGNP